MKAMKVILEGDGYADGYPVLDTAICPRCGFVLDDDYDERYHHEPYCPHCGQRLIWEGDADADN